MCLFPTQTIAIWTVFYVSSLVFCLRSEKCTRKWLIAGDEFTMWHVRVECETECRCSELVYYNNTTMSIWQGVEMMWKCVELQFARRIKFLKIIRWSVSVFAFPSQCHIEWRKFATASRHTFRTTFLASAPQNETNSNPCEMWMLWMGRTNGSIQRKYT